MSNIRAMKHGAYLMFGLFFIASIRICDSAPIPTIAPTAEQIADAMKLTGSSIKVAPANIDPGLHKDDGVRWRYAYRLSTRPGYTLVIAVLSPKYVPKPNEALGEPDKANPPARKSTAANGDVTYVFANPIPGNRTEHVARLKRHQADWDLIVTIFPDSDLPSANPSMFDDSAMKTLVDKTAEILSHPTPSPGPPKAADANKESKKP